MSLSKTQIKSLLDLIASADCDGGDCEQCYQQLAEFAETKLAGADVPEALRTVEQHLHECRCCHDEFEMLMAGLKAIQAE